MAKSISGHRTDSTYNRYAIGSERRAMAAGATMEQFYAAQEKARMEAEKARSKRPAGDDFGKDNAEFGKDGKMRRELKH